MKNRNGRPSAVKVTLAAMVLFLMVSGGCRPTVDNYRMAYDAAIGKKQKDMVEDDVLPAGMISLDGPQKRIIDGDTVWFEVRQLGCVGAGPVMPYNVAVGTYMMDTNARAHAGSLEKEYPGSCVARDTDGRYYVIAAGYDSIAPAARLAVRIGGDVKMTFPGLGGHPVVIETVGKARQD